MTGVLVTLVVATLSYAGAVRPLGLVLFVLPAVLVTSALCLRLSVRRHAAAVAGVGVLVALGVAEIVNVVSGLSYGPAARSSFAAAGGAAVAVAAARSRFPALFLLPVAEVVGGALALGAGGEVKLVAVATAACGLVALAQLDADRARWVDRSRMVGSVLVGLLVVIAVGVVAVALQDQRVTRRPAVLFPAVTDQRVHPFWHEHAPTPKPKSHVVPHPRAGVATSRRSASSPWLGRTLLGLLALVLVLVLAVAARLLAVHRAWRRLRRRLGSGAPAAATVGAWIWTRTSLAAVRRALPPDVSPDRVGDAAQGVPAAAVQPLTALGAAATLAAFAAPETVTGADAVAAWDAADEVVAAVEGALSRGSRWARRWRKPPNLSVPMTSARRVRSVMSDV